MFVKIGFNVHCSSLKHKVCLIPSDILVAICRTGWARPTQCGGARVETAQCIVDHGWSVVVNGYSHEDPNKLVDMKALPGFKEIILHLKTEVGYTYHMLNPKWNVFPLNVYTTRYLINKCNEEDYICAL
ncbi:hypothetical protein PoB_001145400 [Plakobranchus ocellatus]|uniref:Uncharacterized protein n=1 Tax=Plakobranchus ocellatus TaxID=259542 RepID=A0AAV3YSC6_9GAST|nr:hypothetical protein PoB_001145400 [Plakobranchus ocellatus]